MNQKISIIIPVLNEATRIRALLAELSDSPEKSDVEIIVVDGGSQDESVAVAKEYPCTVLASNPGRAKQMNLGAEAATNNTLLFLHVDSFPPTDFKSFITSGLEHSGKSWGRFNVKLSGQQWLLRIVSSMMNWRSAMTGICTGDQGLFMTKAVFDAIDGFPDIPLMEDVEISRRLNTLSKPLVIKTELATSSRRWEKEGIVRTILLMWQLRALYFFGVSPAKLALRYRPSCD
ncbi:MAG: TIGR04283 family arsenosugar biosynthesis glycosyltransferase [Pseudomonadales bacterium]|nr:TIGR04283 family arsenosugar biosynthesis glycosyltransferase [Pseudomonadales bacterium]